MLPILENIAKRLVAGFQSQPFTVRRGNESASRGYSQARISVVATFPCRWIERPKTTTTVTEETSILLDVLADGLGAAVCLPTTAC